MNESADVRKYLQNAFQNAPEEVREYFRKQGSIGGKKRAKSLTPERRQEIAKLAIATRWAKKKTAKQSVTSTAASPKRSRGTSTQRT